MTTAHNIDFVKMKKEIALDKTSLENNESVENVAQVKKRAMERNALLKVGYTKSMNSDLERVARYQENKLLIADIANLEQVPQDTYAIDEVLDQSRFLVYENIMFKINGMKNDQIEEGDIRDAIYKFVFMSGKTIPEEHPVMKSLRRAYNSKIARNYLNYYASKNRTENRDEELGKKLTKLKKSDNLSPALQQAITNLGL
jgi:hypothetical protein